MVSSNVPQFLYRFFTSDDRSADVSRCDHHAPEDVPEGLNQSLKDLQLDYLDLYLVCRSSYFRILYSSLLLFNSSNIYRL
jgi:aryl-alcohol dehydrogenase-like predicted oxidoreductase